jgi:hypothetical protein
MSENPESVFQRRGVVGWIARHPRMSIAGVVLVLLALLVLILHKSAENRLARQIAAIRARGEPVTLEDLRDRVPTIPDDENMALAVFEHAAAFKSWKLPEHLRDANIYSPRQWWRPPSGQRLPSLELEAATWYSEHFAAELAAIHGALKLEHGVFPIGWKTPGIAMLAPHLSDARQISRIMSLDAVLQAERGDQSALTARLLDMCRMPATLDHQPFLISALVHLAMSAMAMEEIEYGINVCPLNETDVELLQRAIRRFDGNPDMAAALMTERVMFLDCVQWVRSSGGNFAALTGGTAPPAGALRFLPILPARDAAAGLRFYTEFIDALKLPTVAERVTRLQAVEKGVQGLPMYYFLTRMLVPSFSWATELFHRSIGSTRAMVAALACERYRLRHGEWPAGLEALVPEFLDPVPVDPFDDEPIRYKRFDMVIKVWSIGEDMTDDGGDVKRLERRTSTSQPTDWGWVLLDPEHRGRPADEDETASQPAE